MAAREIVEKFKRVVEFHKPRPDVDLSHEKDLLKNIEPGSADILGQIFITTLKNKGEVSIVEDIRSSGGYMNDAMTLGGATSVFSFGKVVSEDKIGRMISLTGRNGADIAKELAERNFKEEFKLNKERGISIATYGDAARDEKVYFALKKVGKDTVVKEITVNHDRSLNERKQEVAHQAFLLSLEQMRVTDISSFQFSERVFFDEQYFKERQLLIQEIAYLIGSYDKFAIAESMTGAHIATAFADAELPEGYEGVFDFSNIVYSETSKGDHFVPPSAYQGDNTYSVRASDGLMNSTELENRQSLDGIGTDKTTVFAGDVGLAEIGDTRTEVLAKHKPGEFYFTINLKGFRTYDRFILLPVPEGHEPIKKRLMMKELATNKFLEYLYTLLLIRAEKAKLVLVDDNE